MEQFDICKEIGSTAWIDSLGFELESTKELFAKNLKKFTSNSEILRKRQEPIRELRSKLATADSETLKTIPELFKKSKQLESNLKEFETAPKEWEKEGKSQILFTQEFAKPLNQIPYVLPAAAIFKIYIVPFFAVILPLLAWILPYVIIRIFFRLHMPFEIYKGMILNMWLGGKPWGSLDTWGQLRVVFQSAWTLFGLFQGIYQPIQQAYHTKAIDDTIVKHGILLQDFVKTSKTLLEMLGAVKGKTLYCSVLSEIPIEEPRQTYAYARENMSDVKWIWRKLAEEELEWRLATASELEFANFTEKGPSLILNDFFDPSISKENCVVSTIVLSKPKQHSLLTGPNKGGKSSTLRAICLSIWFGQTYGMIFAKSGYWTPFSWIRSGLRLVDSPGSESLFERELEFATKTLRFAQSKKPGIILYDECFHSTNPPDGEKTAQLFLKNLWANSNVLSVISTHVFSLVDSAPEQILKLCVPAKEVESGIEYSFRLAPGICKVSSVEELYKKFGFPNKVRTIA